MTREIARKVSLHRGSRGPAISPIKGFQGRHLNILKSTLKTSIMRDDCRTGGRCLQRKLICLVSQPGYPALFLWEETVMSPQKKAQFGRMAPCRKHSQGFTVCSSLLSGSSNSVLPNISLSLVWLVLCEGGPHPRWLIFPEGSSVCLYQSPTAFNALKPA